LALVMSLAIAQTAIAGGASADPIFRVPGNAAGSPLPFTIRAGGFTPGSQVNIEQCDGVNPSSVGWSVNTDCDLSVTASPVFADAHGVATFPADGGSHQFTAVKGESPSSLFNCLSPNQAALAPTNGLVDYRNCKIRLSSSNSSATSDQKFLNIELPDT